MTYCNLCNGLTIERLFPPNIYCHAKNTAALEESSQSCSLCMMIYRCVQAAGGPWSEYNPSPYIDWPSRDGVDYMVPVDPSLVGSSADHFVCHEMDGNGDNTTSSSDDSVASGIHSLDSDGHEDKDSSQPMRLLYDTIRGDDNYNIKLQIVEDVPRSGSSIDLNGFTHIGIWQKSERMLSSLTLMVQEDDELGFRAISKEGNDKYISGRVLTIHHPCEAYFNKARRWLKECDSTHSQCGNVDTSNSNTTLPDRVIDVSLDGGNPRLITGRGLKAQYATLSHCWGSKPLPMQTLTSNLEQRMAEILLEDLPKTFREAITICRKLAIPYLWIDSICIIQDSPQDWQIQSSKMHSIYHDSAITLAAIDAVDSSQGLFLPKHPLTDIVPLPGTFGGRGQAYVGPPSFDRYSHALVPVINGEQRLFQQVNSMASVVCFPISGVLHTRAWALQELRLSRRVLHFFKGEMMWRCIEALWHQNGCRRNVQLGVISHLRTAYNTYEYAFELAREEHIEELLRENRSSSKRKRDSSIGSYAHANADEQDHEESDQYDDHGIENMNDDYVTEKRARTSKAPLESHETSGCHVDASIRDTRDNYHQDAAFTKADAVSNRRVFDIVLERLEGYTLSNIENTWFSIVEDYSTCQLTKSTDKLPALSGIASRFHSITKDEYIAGHWRISLAQTLFWESYDEASRAKSYRAPSWSWPSVDGRLRFSGIFVRETVDPNSFRIHDAYVRVPGDNPYGCISSGELVVSASTMHAHWSSKQRGWLSSSRASFGTDIRQPKSKLLILDRHGNRVGYWKYDDALNGVLPGQPLTANTTQLDVEARMLFKPQRIFENFDISQHLQSLWQSAAYAPEDLLFVKGPNGRLLGDKRDEDHVLVLVLKRASGRENDYERVGIGAMDVWDDSVAKHQMLKIV